jgi:hypothetical protein
MRGYLAMASFLAATLCFLGFVCFGGSVARAAIWAATGLVCAGILLLLLVVRDAAQSSRKSPHYSIETKLDRALRQKLELEAQLMAVDADLEKLCQQVDGQVAGMLKRKESATL